MNKFIKLAAVGMVAVMPFMALAHDGGLNLGLSDKSEVNAELNEGVKADAKTDVSAQGSVNGFVQNLERRDGDNDNDANENNHHLMGTVTAISSTGFTLTTADGSVFTVNTQNASLTQAFVGPITLTSVLVNDKANVEGSLNGSVMSANHVVVTPPNTHKAVGKGTVTAVGTNSFTVQANNHGIPGSFTVNTNASTTVTGPGGATSTLSSIVVGTKVVVKGLWDEILNVLKAFSIHIR